MDSIEFLHYQPDSGIAIILLSRDKDSKTQLQELGTNEIRMGSTYIKFSTIIHLDQYHRDNLVHKVINARDARMKVERKSNKRKIVEHDQNENETSNEPHSKVFKPGYGTEEAANKDTTSPEETPSAGFSTDVPKLEPKEEPKELETEDMKTELGESKTFEEISDALKPGIKSEKMINEDNNESEDEILVAKVIKTADNINKAKDGVYQTETEKKKAWENLQNSVSNQNLKNKESDPFPDQDWKNLTKLLAKWREEDMVGYTGSIEVQRKLIKNISNDRCNQIDRKTFVNDMEKILPFRARLKVSPIRYLSLIRA